MPRFFFVTQIGLLAADEAPDLIALDALRLQAAHPIIVSLGARLTHQIEQAENCRLGNAGQSHCAGDAATLDKRRDHSDPLLIG
jgi:hypothetical protein